MKSTLYKIVLAVICFSAISLAREPQTNECQEERPNLEAGHIQLTDENYNKWKKANSKLAVVGLSDSSCKKCCETESILSQLKQKFDDKVFTGKKGKKIQIGRVDIAEQYKFVKKEGFPTNDVPQIMVMFDGTYYRYQLDSTIDDDESYDQIAGVLHFINRLQQPLVILDIEEQVERFLDHEKETAEIGGFFRKESSFLGSYQRKLQHQTRVLVFMFDKEEYATEMKMIREAGRINAHKLGFRMALVTDHKLIRQYKARKGNLWFNDEVQLSTIVVQRFDKQTFAMDLFNLESVATMVHFMNKKSLQPVTELTGESSRLLETVGQQILIGVTHLDSKSPQIQAKSKELVDKTLESIAPMLYRGMSVATIDYSRGKEFLTKIGLTESDMPLIYVTDTINQWPNIYEGELESDAIRVWAQDLLKRSQYVAQDQDQASGREDGFQPRPAVDTTLVPLLEKAGVNILKQASDLDDLLAFEGDDICIFIFSSAIDDDTNRWMIGQYADLTSETRRNTKRLKFVGYELNMLGPHSAIQQGHPNVLLSPGNQRDKQPRLFRGTAQVEEMAEWLMKHSDHKFKMVTKDIDQRLQMVKYAGENLDLGSLSQSEEKPKNIMDEVEAELQRRGEL